MILKLKHHFEAAHRLVNHPGKCFNLHGHRWEVEVKLDGKLIEGMDMLIDFQEIKKIIDYWDHATLLSDDIDNIELVGTLKRTGLKVIVLRFEPTAENLVKKIYERFELYFLRDKIKIKVKLWESPGAMVEYDGS